MSSSIPFRMVVCGLDELPDHGAVGITHVLSILDPEWPVPDAFGSFAEHERLELRFHDIIEEQAGMLPPQPGHVAQLLSFGRDVFAEPPPGAHLLVHCHAGISRSTASLILMAAQGWPGRPESSVAQEILRIRPKAWPNLRIIEMGDAQLGREGRLVAAAIEIYREQLARRPELASFMIESGRGREVEAGLRLQQEVR